MRWEPHPATAMPWRSFADGPECEDPKLIARRWDDDEEIRDRAKDKQKLVQLVKDEDGNEVAWPTGGGRSNRNHHKNGVGALHASPK